MAATLGVRRQRVLYLERGKGQLQIAFVFALLKALNLEMSLSPVSVKGQRTKLTSVATPYSIDDIVCFPSELPYLLLLRLF